MRGEQQTGRTCPVHGIPDCSPLLNGCGWAPPSRVSVDTSGVGGLTDTERVRRILMDPAFRVGPDVRREELVDVLVHRIVAAREQGRADLAVKVEAELQVLESAALAQGGIKPGVQKLLDRFHAVLDVEPLVHDGDNVYLQPREDVTHTHLSVGHVDGCPGCEQVKQVLERPSVGPLTDRLREKGHGCA